jgi:hypothetical protein
MIPPTMKFTSRSNAFRPLPAGNNSYQVEAANQVKAGEGPGFEISGLGALPSLQGQAQTPAKPPVATLPTSALSASGFSGGQAHAGSANALSAVPLSRFSAPSSQLQWWIWGVSFVLVLGACGLFFSRRQRLNANPTTTPAQRTEHLGRAPALLAEVLKEELFQLEIDRFNGAISGEEYDSARQALETTFSRTFARSEAAPGEVRVPSQVRPVSR